MMSTPDFSLNGHTALITGATQGLGLAIAKAYSTCGARVIINGRHPQRVNDIVDQLKGEGADAHACPLDIAELDKHQQALATISKTAGPPSILVNNAGIRIRKSLDAFNQSEILELMHVNLVAAIAFSRLVAQSMVHHRQQGRIVTITSIAGELARPGDTVYPIAKQGLAGLVRALAVEYGGHGITSNGIAPGTFATEANQAISNDPEASRRLIGRNPLKRWARPDEITGPAVFLASPAASYINGHILVVDGGYSITY